MTKGLSHKRAPSTNGKWTHFSRLLDDDLNPAIFGSTVSRLVARNRIAFSMTSSRQVAGEPPAT